MSPSSSPTPLWRRSFDKLKMSADDGARLLWLDFGGEDGEIVSDIFPEYVLCIIQTSNDIPSSTIVEEIRDELII